MIRIKANYLLIQLDRAQGSFCLNISELLTPTAGQFMRHSVLFWSFVLVRLHISSLANWFYVSPLVFKWAIVPVFIRVDTLVEFLSHKPRINWLMFPFHLFLIVGKGQLLLKGLFGVFNSSKKRTKKLNFQVCFLEELKTPNFLSKSRSLEEEKNHI